MAGMVTKVVKTYSLTISEKERLYLKGVLQNFMGPHEDAEPSHEKKIRKELWHALNAEDYITTGEGPEGS